MKHELTVTLRPMMYSMTAKQQFDITKRFILDILKPYKHTTVAELTGEHNVHYHSIVEIEGIKMKDELLNRFRGYNKHLGRKTCTGLQFEKSYEKYLFKDYKDTFAVLGADPVLKDDYNLRSEHTDVKLYDFKENIPIDAYYEKVKEIPLKKEVITGSAIDPIMYRDNSGNLI